MYRLDIFEAEEYEKRLVRVQLLDTKARDEEMEVEAETYVWAEGMKKLEDEEWDFEDFVKEKMARWIGHVEYAEVDEAALAMANGDDPTGGRGMSPAGEKEVLRSAV